MTKYTNKQRSKIYKVKSKIKPTIATRSVPKGKSKTAKEERSRMLKKIIPDYYGKYYCPALKDNVVINSNISLHKMLSASIIEQKSTIAALMLKELIKKAELIYKTKPKDNAGQKSFSAIYVLVAAIRGIGWAKLTIGKYKEDARKSQAPYCQYCVKHLSIHELKNK